MLALILFTIAKESTESVKYRSTSQFLLFYKIKLNLDVRERDAQFSYCLRLV